MRLIGVLAISLFVCIGSYVVVFLTPASSVSQKIEIEKSPRYEELLRKNDITKEEIVELKRLDQEYEERLKRELALTRDVRHRESWEVVRMRASWIVSFSLAIFILAFPFKGWLETVVALIAPIFLVPAGFLGISELILILAIGASAAAVNLFVLSKRRHPKSGLETNSR